VAATKTYTSQVATMLLLALHFAEVRGTVSAAEIRAIKEALLEAPEQIERILERESEVAAVARRHYQQRSALYLARGVHLASAMEGALKLKEISYIHAEAYSAGEMKHGPIALVCPEMFVVALALQGPTYDEMIGNIMEVKARGGPVVALACDGDKRLRQVGLEPSHSGEKDGEENDLLSIPSTHEYVSPITAAIPLQLLAYHIAELRGEDIDQPRNLAKTVTVK
jgi:glucosamine--fructose-6-phosphate aminotransferase (isomerizing)